MAIYEYGEGDHPADFIGVRVACWIGSKQRSRHFSFRCANGRICSIRQQQRIRREAKQLDRQWQQEREENRQTGSVWATGIKGISATFAAHRKRRSSGVVVYYYPVFKVAGSTANSRYQRAFYIGRASFDEAWNDAVAYYARSKGYKRWAHLRRLRPDPAQFRRIRREMNRRGDSIPASRLPSGA